MNNHEPDVTDAPDDTTGIRARTATALEAANCRERWDGRVEAFVVLPENFEVLNKFRK